MKYPKLLFFGIDGAMPSYIKKEVEKGNLPGFARIMKQGVFFNDCMPVFPTISPTCWNSVHTGAVPGVHGGIDQNIHIPGDNPWEFITSYHGSNIQAEKFWETAAKKGYKSLILSVCSSGPAKTDNVSLMFGHSTRLPRVELGAGYVSGSPQQYLHINTGESRASLLISGTKETGAKPKSEAFDLSQGIQLAPNTFEFKALKGKHELNANEIQEYSWVVITHPDGVQVGADIDSTKAAKIVGIHEWTEPISRELMTDMGPCMFHFRARLEEMDAKSGRYVVYITPTYNLLKEVQNIEDARKIMDIAEVHTVYCGLEDAKTFCMDKYFDTQAFDFSWRRQVLQRMTADCDYDFIFDLTGTVDAMNHQFRSYVEGLDEFNCCEMEPEDPRIKEVEKIFSRCYQQVDEHISWLLDNMVGEETQICIMSDHGSIGSKDTFHQHLIMEKAGLLTYLTDVDDEKTWRNNNIDWTKTKAYCVGSCQINVNLQGREPCGIVKPEDYHKVVGEIIDALWQYGRTPEGFPMLSFAVPGDQAGFFGQKGENCADVVFGLSGGPMGGYFGVVHAQQIPSAKSERGGDMRSLCIMSGSKFKKDCILERPMDLTDIAPTMCYAAGLPQPKDATGGIVFQAFQEEM